MTSADWVLRRFSGFYSSLWAVAFVGNRCAEAKKNVFTRTIHGLDEKTRWLDIAFFFGFGKVQYNQKLPRELHFPNQRSNDMSSVVWHPIPAPLAGLESQKTILHTFFSKSSFWVSILVFGSVCRFIGGCHLEYIRDVIWVYFAKLCLNWTFTKPVSWFILWAFVVPNLDFVHWAMMFNTHPLKVSS